MIIYRKDPYHLQMRNIMLLDDAPTGGLIYVNKDTYDQALLLSGRMDGNPQRVLDIIKSPKNEIYRTMPEFKALMENMMQTMPKPLNMIAPFMLLCVSNQGIVWNKDDRVFAYGILHQLSQLIDFNGATTIPAQMRNDVTLPTALLMQYEASWNELCSSLEDKIISVTLENEDKQALPEEVMTLLEDIRTVMNNLQTVGVQQPQIIYQQPVVTQQPIVTQQSAEVAKPAEVAIQSTVAVEEKKSDEPTIDTEPKVEKQAEEVKPVVQDTTQVAENKPAENSSTGEMTEDEKKEAAVAAIIAKMKESSANRDRDKKEKLDKLTEGQASKTEDSTNSYHTDFKHSKEEAQAINNVLNEYDF